jgi:hypothetical protein
MFPPPAVLHWHHTADYLASFSKLQKAVGILEVQFHTFLYVTHIKEISQNLHLKIKCNMVFFFFLTHYVGNFILTPVWPFEAYSLCILDKEIHI